LFVSLVAHPVAAHRVDEQPAGRWVEPFAVVQNRRRPPKVTALEKRGEVVWAIRIARGSLRAKTAEPAP
jgi:hypothetical protein